MKFYSTCVGWPDEDVDAEGGLCDMIYSARAVTRRTFLKHVDRAELDEIERQLGYVRRRPGLTMASDWHVSYHRSKLHGGRTYFFKHSAIEHVFL